MTDLAMIVAVAKNNVIGIDNMLPWHIPEDMKWFKRHTMGKPMIMGRKTYESLGRPLPGRAHIVISRNKNLEQEGVFVVPNLEEAIALGEKIASKECATEIMVIGGGTIYVEALPKVNRIYRTLVELEPEGDTYFPELSSEWKVNEEEKNVSSNVNFLFQVVEKTL